MDNFILMLLNNKKANELDLWEKNKTMNWLRCQAGRVSRNGKLFLKYGFIKPLIYYTIENEDVKYTILPILITLYLGIV